VSDAVHTHWEVTRAKNAGQKPNPHGGQFDKWYVGLKNLDGGDNCDDAYWQRKAPSTVEVGDKVYGKVEKGDYGWRFYVEKEGDAVTTSGGSKNYGGGSKEWLPESQYDPEKTARIGRAHAQGMAIQTLTAMGTFESQSADQITGKLKEWIEFFEADVNAAAQKAAQAGERRSHTAGSPGSPVAQETQSNAEYLSKLLEESGFDPAQVTVVQRYIETNFDNERRTKVEAALKDISRAPKAYDQLKQEAEAWTGEALPVDDPASTELPF